MKPASATRSRTVNTLGLLLVAAAIALSWPGVRAVRADEPDMTPVGAADYSPAPDFERVLSPSASPGFGGVTPDASPEACGDPAAQRADSRARAQLLAGIPQPRPGEPGIESQPGVVLLNNRGYNYGATDGPNDAQWLQLEREMLAGAE